MFTYLSFFVDQNAIVLFNFFFSFFHKIDSTVFEIFRKNETQNKTTTHCSCSITKQVKNK